MRVLFSLFKVHRLLAGAMLAGTVSSSLLVAPGPPASVAAVQEPTAVAPIGTSRVRPIRHEAQPKEAPDLVTIYTLYVPPPPPPPSGIVTIAVPIYRQAMPLDCETSALRMGLATYGHYYSDSGLFAYENADLRSPVMAANHVVLQWGDPYTNFVGNVWGAEWIPTGYGIYYPVIASIARSHGLPNAYGGEGFSPDTIYAALRSGHPVEVWIEFGWVRNTVRTWTAWDGRAVRYSLHEHAVTLSGVSPGSVRVNDPYTASQYWVSKATFESVWADFHNMAVIFQ